MDNYLADLEKRSISIIREAKAQFKNPAVLWSTGKDSTATVWLCKKPFFGKIPFPVIHIDTSYKFPQIYEFRDRIAKEWNLNLIIAKNEKALKNGMSPKKGRLKCCTQLKTEALKNLLREQKFDALILAVRRDEHAIRAKERYYSPRDEEFRWNYANQPAELWDLYVKPSARAFYYEWFQFAKEIFKIIRLACTTQTQITPKRQARKQLRRNQR